MRLLLILQLALGTYVPQSASAATKLDTPMLAQMVSEIALASTLQRQGEIKTGADLVKLMPGTMNARDARWLKEKTKGLNKPVELERLNRGLKVTYEGKSYVITIEDVIRGRLRLNGKVDFTYQVANPLEIQMEVLGRALDRNQARFSFGLPEAHAIWPMIGAALVGGLVAAALGKALESSGTVFQQWYCPGRSKAESYFTSNTCEKYFDWADKNNKPSERVPNKEDTKAAAAAPTTPAVVTNDCAKSKFTSTIEGDGATEMEVTYKEKKADKILITQTIEQPGAGPKTVNFEIALDDQSQLKAFKVLTTGELLGTNDPAVTAKMTPTQLAANQKQIEKGSKLVTNMIGFLDFCKKKGEETIAKNAVRPADSLASTTPTPAVIAPVIPTMAPTTAQ